MQPTIFILTCLIGVVMRQRYPRIGWILVTSSAGFLYLFSTPAAPILIEQQFLSAPIANVEFGSAQAIVVPCVDTRWGDQAGTPDAVGALTLERLAAAARLYRRLRVPVLVTGGTAPNYARPPPASLMRDELEQNFSVPVSFMETQAQNTFENGLYASRILATKGIHDVLIVAQERDLPRLLWSFERAGLHPIPAAITRHFGSLELYDLLPSASAFLESYYDVHELIGIVYYTLTYETLIGRSSARLLFDELPRGVSKDTWRGRIALPYNGQGTINYSEQSANRAENQECWAKET
jgi:uncharacterized SAM-binding protein YcdF (DUF218 family)